MNTKKKILMALALVGCAILLVVGSVAVTMAYLTSKTGTITNTFTVGNIAITMDESVTDLYGAVTSGKTTTGNEYKLIPGQSYTKDPTIHVAAKSENAYLFVKVENGIADIEDSSNTIAAQLTENGWTSLNGVANVYYQTYTSKDTDLDVAIFSSFKIASTFTGDTTYADAEVKVTAYAIQQAGFADANAAWTASGFGN